MCSSLGWSNLHSYAFNYCLHVSPLLFPYLLGGKTTCMKRNFFIPPCPRGGTGMKRSSWLEQQLLPCQHPPPSPSSLPPSFELHSRNPERQWLTGRLLLLLLRRHKKEGERARRRMTGRSRVAPPKIFARWLLLSHAQPTIPPPPCGTKTLLRAGLYRLLGAPILRCV